MTDTTSRDGRFYASDRAVFRAPRQIHKDDGRTAFTLGFRLCILDEWMGDDAANTVAAALNAALDRGEIDP